MKQKYTFTVAGQPLTFLSDEDSDFVKAIINTTDKTVTDIMMSGARCARLDAALICAIDFCSEKTKAEKKVKNLEAQISLYEATVARLKKEIAAASAAPAAPDVQKIAEVTEAELGADAGTADGESLAEVTKAEVFHEAPKEKPDHAKQLAEIEALLKSPRAAEKAKEKERAEARQMKLDEIEALLRK